MYSYKVVLKYDSCQNTMYSNRPLWNNLNNLKIYGYYMSEFEEVSENDRPVETIAHILRGIRGNFAAIYEGKNCVWIATDSIGSVPVYYGCLLGYIIFLMMQIILLQN